MKYNDPDTRTLLHARGHLMFAKELSHDGHIKRFLVLPAGEHGWEVREEQDSRVVRRVCYTDWHRVERALSLFSLQVSELAREGWQVSNPHPS